MEESVLKIPRVEFYEQWLKFRKNFRNEELLKFVLNQLTDINLTDKGIQLLKDQIVRISVKINKRWVSSNRKAEVFNIKFSSWLAQDSFEFRILQEEMLPSTSQGHGRPQKSFAESSNRTKKRKVQHLLHNSSDVLTHATYLSLYGSGDRRAAKTIKRVTTLKSTASVGEHSSNDVRDFTPVEALALFVDCRLSKASYIWMRQRAINVGHPLYPPYYRLQEEKKNCMPSIEVNVTEIRAEMSVQAVLDHTAKGLCAVQYPVLQQLLKSGYDKLILFSKWGCDGSSRQSEYKQKFQNESSESNDSFLFMFSFVPIHLKVANKPDVYAWCNPTPGSTTYCRPLKFLFQKESTPMTINETKNTAAQISALKPTCVVVDGQDISIEHNLVLTMVDGKVCNALTGTRSTTTCYICEATTKLRQTTDRPMPVDADKIENYTFGLSALHAWIRVFECLLQISYKLEIMKWQIRNEKDKLLRKNRKASIQEKFKSVLGLNIDKPKHGYGNSNDGNTARTFFRNPQIVSSITGLDEHLIQRFSTILQALSSGYSIDVQAFEKYAVETKALFVDLYPWFPLPVTVHKILEHSSQIIQHHIVPIGQLTEEAQEALIKSVEDFENTILGNHHAYGSFFYKPNGF